MSAQVTHPNFNQSSLLRWLSDGIQVSDAERQRAALRNLIAQLGPEQAFEVARRNEVASILGHAAAENDETSASRFASEHRIVGQRISRYMDRLDGVASALGDASIPLVALKNSGIARGIHTCAGCCPMGDVDVLVRRSDFRKAHQVLVELGYHFEFRSPLEVADEEEAEKSGGTEYWLEDTDGRRFWLELQWRPVAGRWIRPDQEPEGDSLIDRSVPIAGSRARLLSPVDNLLQVALHTAKHTYVRAPGFRLHTDVDRIVSGQQVDWDAFLRQVVRLQVRTPVYFSLLLASRLLGSNVPFDVLDQLKAGDRKCRWIASQLDRVGLLEPHQPKFSRWQYMAFNAALYDDMGGLWRAIFPGVDWMRQRYGMSSPWLLPVGYARRAADLLTRRVNT